MAGSGPEYLFERNTLKSFQNLRDQYGLASQDLFRFLQLRHHVNKLISKEDMLKLLSGTGILSVFISAYRADQGHKTISKLYKGLQELSGVNTSYIKEKWEREGNFVLSIEEWDNLIERQWKSTNSLTWREFNWKHLVRYFITPVQTRKGQMVCWRGCGSVRVNHHHVFWECPGIVHYWDSIRDGMESVLNIEIDLCFQVLYLGKMSQQLLGFSKMYMFKVMLVASKKKP